MICEPRGRTAAAPRRKVVVQEHEEDEPEVLDNSIEAIALRAVENDDFDGVTTANFGQIIIEIRAIQKRAMDEYDYERAEAAENAIKKTEKVKTLKTMESINTAETEDMCCQLEATRNDLEYLREHWNALLRSACERRDEELTQMRQDQANELNAFDENVESGELPIQYRKMSPEYLQLRRRQKAMVSSKRYIEAKEMKQMADELEQKELQSNYERYRTKMDAERRELVKKHQEKYDIKQMIWKRNIHAIQKQADYEIGHAKKSAEHIEDKITQREIFAVTAGFGSQDEPVTSRSTVVTKQSKRQQPSAATSAQIMFRQRAMINKFQYSKVFIPRTKRAPKTAR